VNADFTVYQPNQMYDIGTTPPNFFDDIGNYQDIDLINLIVFYNDDFGITNADELSDRKNKLRAFLLGYPVDYD
jgi:hypothetical protein